MTRRLAPLLAGTAAGSLGGEDLVSLGVSIAAVDLVELTLHPGRDAIRAAGDLAGFLGWRGELVAVALWDGPATVTGWRARALPELIAEADGSLRLRSSVDGSVVVVSRDELAAWGRDAGATLGPGLDDGDSVAMWALLEETPPVATVVVSGLGARAAAAGLVRERGGWVPLPGLRTAVLAEGCGCRACAIATADYIRHLWAEREITAEHLLGWHNLHQLRVELEG